MAALGDDCYFFCTSTCAKGAACPFRHVESAKICRIICQHWQMGGCLRPMCKFRHSDFVFQSDTNEVPCYWEALPTGCVKKNCMYKHLKSRSTDDVASTVAGSTPVDPSTVGTAPSRNDVGTSQTFVQPVVTPVIIQNLAESEESNSSPMKRPPEVTQETTQVTQIQAVPKKQETEMETSENSIVNDDKLSSSPKAQSIKKKTKKVKSGAKKVKQNIAVQKAQKKSVGKNSVKMKAKSTKNNYQSRKSAKERLGKAPEQVKQSSSSEDSDSESSSDSDDSIENIKVMSVEELLRQKALESMRRKRTTERKPSADKRLLSTAGKKSPAQQKFSPPAKNFKKHATPVKRVKHVTAPVESSSSSSEEESSDDKDMPDQSSEKSSTSSSNASSSSSNSSDSEEDTDEDSEDLDVRRVVVDLESEKAARKRAKASFLKKQKLMAASAHSSKNKGQVTRVPAKKVTHMPLSTLNKNNNSGKQQKKRQINVDYDFDDIVSSRVREPLKLSVQDRLGKSNTLHKASSDPRLLYRTEKFSSAVDVSKSIPTKKRNAPIVTTSKKSKSSSSDDDRDSLAEVKVKTLEEIRLEKMRKQSAEENKKKLTSQDRETGAHRPLPVKQRLGKIPAENQNINVDNMKGRQVVLINDTGSKSDDASNLKTLDEQKKAKKRPWRSQRRNMDPSSTETFAGDGERTTVISSPPAGIDDYAAELNSYKKEQNVDESSFERLRRKTLMKKLQSRVLKQPAAVVEGNTVEAGSEILKRVAKVEEDGADSHTHKHKHNHKHHKRVKTERQIYMPPAMKNTPKVPEPSHAPEPASPKRELFTGPTVKVSPQKRGPHPIAAAWAAGLSLSSKGVTVRRPESTLTPAVSSGIVDRLEIRGRLGVKEAAPTKAKEIISSNEASQPSLESSGVTIKSFSEIMAEKRKRRIEMLAQKSGTTDHPTISASVSSLPSSTTVSLPQTPSESNSASSQRVELKPRVPILPIVFAPDKSSSSTGKGTMQAVNSTNSSWCITAQSTTSTTQKESPPVSRSSTPSTKLSVPHSTSITTDKVKLKSVKNSKNNVDKKKKAKKLFTKKNSTEQIDLSCSVTSEGSSNNTSTSSLHPSRATSSVSETTINSRETPSHHNQSSKASSDAPSLYQNLYDSKASASQASKNAVATGSLEVSTKPSVLKLSTKTDSPAVKTSPAPTRKHSISTSSVESEPAKKKTHLSSIEDEFNFFEDEDLSVDDGILPEDIEPIDDLLQDIDDLLS